MAIWIEWAGERFGWDTRHDDHDASRVVDFVPIYRGSGSVCGLVVFRNGLDQQGQYQTFFFGFKQKQKQKQLTNGLGLAVL